jgi:hypothetical protein
MASAITKGLLVGATLLGGLLAGMAVNKVLIQIPAWEEPGVIPWANFTRATNLGLGLILFPVIGGSALLLTVAAAVAFRFDRARPRSGIVPVYAAVVLAIAAFIVTVCLLAPPRLSLKPAASSAADLQLIFASVTRWWGVKALLHLLTFGSNLWALVAVFSFGGPGNRSIQRPENNSNARSQS